MDNPIQKILENLEVRFTEPSKQGVYTNKKIIETNRQSMNQEVPEQNIQPKQIQIIRKNPILVQPLQMQQLQVEDSVEQFKNQTIENQKMLFDTDFNPEDNLRQNQQEVQVLQVNELQQQKEKVNLLQPIQQNQIQPQQNNIQIVQQQNNNNSGQNNSASFGGNSLNNNFIGSLNIQNQNNKQNTSREDGFNNSTTKKRQQTLDQMQYALNQKQKNANYEDSLRNINLRKNSNDSNSNDHILDSIKESGNQKNQNVLTNYFPKQGIKKSSNPENKFSKQSMQKTLENNENAYSDLQVKSLMNEITEKNKIIRENKEYMSKLEQQKINDIEKLRKEMRDKLFEFERFKQRIRDQYAQEKLLFEMRERTERNREIRLQKERIGEIFQNREGSQIVETWKEGEEFKALRYKMEKIQQEKELLENQKKELKKIPKKPNGNFCKEGSNGFIIDDGSNSNNNEFGILEAKERISYRLQILEKEEKTLREEEERLNHLKQLLIQNIKLEFEENNCRFGKHDLPTSQQWPRIGDNQRYQLLSLLGKGGFSEVYKCFDLEDFNVLAIKVHQLNPNWSENTKQQYVKHAMREYQVHEQLNHPNIVKLFGTVEIDSNSFGTCLEYCEGPDLSFYLKQNKILTEKEAKVLIRQIIQGLRHMHNFKTRVIHYDLKPQNIIFHKGELKISDFGLCKVMEDNSTRMELTSQGVGTYWYLPPETFEQSDSDVKISPKVDIWSLGVIFFEMLYGQRPFGHGMSQTKILRENIILKATSVDFPPKPIVSKECQDFIRRCLTYDQNLRWDINEICISPYMTKKDNIQKKKTEVSKLFPQN